MSSVFNIRAMYQTMELHEQIADASVRSATVSSNDEPVFYWHIERKKKRGKGWVFVRDLTATKREAARVFCKWFRDGEHRLRWQMAY